MFARPALSSSQQEYELDGRKFSKAFSLLVPFIPHLAGGSLLYPNQILPGKDQIWIPQPI